MAGFGSQVRAQDKIAPGVSPPLVLTEAIPLAGVQGRFDHFGFDRKNQLFVAALGNNSVEVIDISARSRVHSITGIPNPQGVVYAAETKKLFAASSTGQLYIYDAATFEFIKSIAFHGDVDNLRYDAAIQRVYVGYDEDETGAIGTVDAKTNERLDEEYNSDHYRVLAKVPSTLGARTAGYFGKGRKGFDHFFLAVPARADHGAEMWIYTVQD